MPAMKEEFGDLAYVSSAETEWSGCPLLPLTKEESNPLILAVRSGSMRHMFSINMPI